MGCINGCHWGFFEDFMAMREYQLATFRTLLENQLEELRESIDEHDDDLNTPPANRDFVGADRAQELEDLETGDAILHSEENLMVKVQNALSRIQSGTYGRCEGCGDEIPLSRLEAKPSVSLCLSCQEKHDNA